ncbi:VCBS repeat-containing protein [Aquimarina sediminis]|uniref:VCBS repeat-containing protein n=1 Tax=Aquimarina sediminis TaxID=2070536 RepID=UPI000CA08519|nr:VCBS repeat-containing protein [Aquimarina sediminis]
MRNTFLIIFLSILTLSCSKQEKPIVDESNREIKKMFERLPFEETNISFTNEIANNEELNIFKYRNFYNGGGVAIGDINNDGYADVFLTANMKKNKLYLNKGSFVFEDITIDSGVQGKNNWSTGVVMVDINSDGWLDIYVCNAGDVKGDNQKNELYINNKDLTFTEAAEEYNLADSGFTTHAAFFDYDKDGDLDAYILNNSFIPVSSLGYSNKREIRSEDWNIPDFLKGGGDKLLRNDNGHFVDVSEEAGIFGSLIGFGLGVTVGDLNNDQYPDLYISNDFYERDYLYINKKDGTFSEEIKSWTSHISMSSMGADLSDINNDGMQDIFVTDMLPEDNVRLKETSDFERYDVLQLKRKQDFYNQYMQNSLQLNNGNNTFSEIAFYSGVAMSDWSWGALLFDMDNDGYKDIYVSNGIYHDLTNQDFMDFFANDILQQMVLTGKKEVIDTIIHKMPSTPIANKVFKNNKDLTFTDRAPQWGLEEPSFSNGAAYGDLDNDGDLDIIVNNVNQPTFVYKNNTDELQSSNYLKVKLKGKNKNTFAIGTKVKVYLDDNKQILQELNPSRGFQSSVDYVLTIGLGDKKIIDSLKIIWPEGTEYVKKNIAVNQQLTFDQNKVPGKELKKIEPQSRKLFKKKEIAFFDKHEENNYIDFDYESLIYKMSSREGPTITFGDLNNDGENDLFIGGGKDQEGQIYLQKNKKYIKSISEIFAEDRMYEDTAACFFDADGDNDLDLIVGAGGNETSMIDSEYDLRLYLNDGNGKFNKSETHLPVNVYNTAVISPYDYDQDGDVDLFVGSKGIPGVYGVNPKHFLLENDGLGNFKNVIKEKIPESKHLGMISEAEWKDIDNDKIKDLIIAEEWGQVHLFRNEKNRFVSIKSNLNEIHGRWSACKVADIDNDGDIDLVLGNQGINSIYKSSPDKELKMYVHDFDNNGTIEQLFTIGEGKKDIPIHLKRELTGQLSFLKKKNMKYSEYAKKTIQELFPKEKLTQAIVKKVNKSESIVAINDGNFNFEIKELLPQAQFSCINDLEIIDVNKDGHLDILFGGNDYSLKPQFSQLDASFGGILLGDGNGDFSWLDYKDSGFFVKGVINDIEVLTDDKNNLQVIVGINNEAPLLFDNE